VDGDTCIQGEREGMSERERERERESERDRKEESVVNMIDLHMFYAHESCICMSHIYDSST